MQEIIRRQLAIENNCRPDDFSRAENIITAPVCCEERRKFHDAPFFLKMVTMGGNAVISADLRVHDALRRFSAGKEGHWLFEHNNLMEVERIVNEYGKRLFQTHHMFLPAEEAASSCMAFPVRWFERAELQPFYENVCFPNALGASFDCLRPDMLAVAACDGGEIIGMAGASADTEVLWQIRIDVNSEYRGQGIGTGLVALLRKEIEARGKIPYYGTSLSNLPSWGIALRCGFRPAWVETETIEW